MISEIANYNDIEEALAWCPRELKNIEARSVVQFNLTEGIVSMFERSGYPEFVNVKMLERFLVQDHRAAITPYNGSNPFYQGKPMAARVKIGGMPDPDGIGQIAICTFGDGTVKEVDNWR